MHDTRVVALVPARNEEDRIAATVSALLRLPELSDVVVIDDGSTDATSPQALAAGAKILAIPRRAGKGRALEGALKRLEAADIFLLADADLAGSASALGAVLGEVLGGRADLAIAALPPAREGGFGMVKRLTRRAIRSLCGFDAREPLSGQRAVTSSALEACRPLARGFGVDAAMTVDAVRAGLRVVEVPVAVSHRATGRSLRGFAHRGRQGLDILRALLPRALGLR